MFTLRQFELDHSVVAPCVYGTESHKVTSLGTVICQKTHVELTNLLKSLCEAAGVPEAGTFFRIDAYPQPDGSLAVLEVNAHFVDGWGVALNLCRATRSPVALPLHAFPKRWTSHEDVYLPELLLTCHELEILGAENMQVISWQEALVRCGKPVYWYGRFRRHHEFSHIQPSHGDALDDKMHLVYLSSLCGTNGHVRIPPTYSEETCAWQSLPTNVVFKCRHKWSGDKTSVRFREDIGRGKDARRRYEAGEMIAQELVPPYLVGERPVQCVILCIGTLPVTGYLQHAGVGTRIINDNSEHGPLVFDGA